MAPAWGRGSSSPASARSRSDLACSAGPRVLIGDAYHDYRDPDTAGADQPMSSPRPVVIGSGAFLGVGSVILPGVTIGERACIGANAVVTSDVPRNAVVVGSPARVIKRWDDDSERWVDEPGGPGSPIDVRAGAW